MNVRNWLAAVGAGVLLSGCAMFQDDPVAEARQALAPTGKLRVAFFAAPIYASKDPASGELKGLGVDIGKELAKRLEVPFEPRPYKDLAALIESAKSGEWDVALSTVDEKRASIMDFTGPYLLVEQGFLVRAGVNIATIADVDKPGVRVGVVTRSTSQQRLSKNFKSATLVEVGNLAGLKELLESEKADAVAIGKTFLYSVADKMPGAHVLDGAILVEDVAMGVTKGRDAAALAFANRVIEDVKSAGLVQNAITRDKLRGVKVAAAR